MKKCFITLRPGSVYVLMFAGWRSSRNEYKVCPGDIRNLHLGEEDAIQCLLSSYWLRNLSTSSGLCIRGAFIAQVCSAFGF